MYEVLGKHERPEEWGQPWPPGFPPPGETPTAKDLAAQAAAERLLAGKAPAVKPTAAKKPGASILAKLYAPGEFPYGLVALAGGTMLLVWLLNRPRRTT